MHPKQSIPWDIKENNNTTNLIKLCAPRAKNQLDKNLLFLRKCLCRLVDTLSRNYYYYNIYGEVVFVFFLFQLFPEPGETNAYNDLFSPNQASGAAWLFTIATGHALTLPPNSVLGNYESGLLNNGLSNSHSCFLF